MEFFDCGPGFGMNFEVFLITTSDRIKVIVNLLSLIFSMIYPPDKLPATCKETNDSRPVTPSQLLIVLRQ